MRTFVIGDIHGAARALLQCLERSNFDRKRDRLISLGDLCDGWYDVYECIEILLTIDNRIDIMGNHDDWFLDFLNTGVHSDPLGPWWQGGYMTAKSYLTVIGKPHLIEKKAWHNAYITALNPGDIPESHQNFFRHQVQYYIDDNNRCFVHGGFNRENTMEENRAWPHEFYWDRTLWEKALCCKKGVKLTTVENFEKIFIGHTSCFNIDGGRPVYAGGVWNLDTGAGWGGLLTIMDVDTEEFWQSDPVSSLYPEVRGRR